MAEAPHNEAQGEEPGSQTKGELAWVRPGALFYLRVSFQPPKALRAMVSLKASYLHQKSGPCLRAQGPNPVLAPTWV